MVLDIMHDNLATMLHNVQVVSIVCNQYGDTGKGKFSDFFAEWADIIARGTGADNAGHTTKVGDVKRVFHLLPAGITYDSAGKFNVLGKGMAINVKKLCAELDEVLKIGGTYDRLLISRDASLIMPYHIADDRSSNMSLKNGGIGSTGNGVGPCYTDKIARRGIRIGDLFDRDVLAEKINKALDHYRYNFDLDTFRARLDSVSDLLITNGQSLTDDQAFQKSKEYLAKIKEQTMQVAQTYLNEIKHNGFNVDDMISELEPFAQRIKPLVRDTTLFMQESYRNGKKISLEGAQGLIISIEFGDGRNVTSSDGSHNGTATGVGLPANCIDLRLGVAKFPILTRVGGGPLITEFGGIGSENYCAEGTKHDKQFELEKYGIPFTGDREHKNIEYNMSHPKIADMLRSTDQFTRGVGVRLAGEEYGATTGRPRRTGVTDAAALKYAVAVNGPNLILTKADIMRGAGDIQLCVGYEGGHDFTPDNAFMRNAKPIYETFPGFDEDISGVTNFNDLPVGLRAAVSRLEEISGGKTVIMSVGPDRYQTIIKK